MKLRNVWPPLIIAFFLAFVCEVVTPFLNNQVYYLTKPIACPTGTMEVRTYQIHSAEWEVRAMCTNDGEKQTVTMQADLILCGMFFGGWFLVVWLLLGVARWRSRRRALTSESGSGLKEDTLSLDAPTYQIESDEPGEGNMRQVERLRELKKMLDEGLITAEEYEAKKRTILSEM